MACTAGVGYGSMQMMNLGVGDLDAHFVVPAAPKPPTATELGEQKTGHKTKKRLAGGIASWYGQVWEGRLTASGEVFRQSAMTACHASLPFGTLVRVINLRNHRSVVVRINDRGLQGTGRVIDLSSAAAEQIGMLDAGLAPVRLEIVRSSAHG